ncbi:MAG: hypothetical protein RL610_899 [Pseudomonadota bacterium]|jgi:hypothetical protein
MVISITGSAGPVYMLLFYKITSAYLVYRDPIDRRLFKSSACRQPHHLKRGILAVQCFFWY